MNSCLLAKKRLPFTQRRISIDFSLSCVHSGLCVPSRHRIRIYVLHSSSSESVRLCEKKQGKTSEISA